MPEETPTDRVRMTPVSLTPDEVHIVRCIRVLEDSRTLGVVLSWALVCEEGELPCGVVVNLTDGKREHQGNTPGDALAQAAQALLSSEAEELEADENEETQVFRLEEEETGEQEA